MTTAQQGLGWGLVGIGRHARRYIAPAMGRSKNSRLVAVCSRDIQRARQFSDEFNGPAAYDSLDALLANKDVHALYVCSPNHVHKEHVLKAAQAGKHVFCEKPLATTVEDGRLMVESCHRAGVKLGVGFHLRHNRIHAVARDKIASRSIGEPLLVEIQYMHATSGSEATFQAPTWRTDPEASGGGRLVSVGGHAIDLLRFLLQRDITKVCAMVDQNWAVTHSENLIQASLLFEGHIIASLSAGALRYPSNQFAVYGTSGTLRCRESIGYDGGGYLDLISDEGMHTVNFPLCDAYTTEIDAFGDSVARGTEPNASGVDGLRVIEVTTAVYESLRRESLVALYEKCQAETSFHD